MGDTMSGKLGIIVSKNYIYIIDKNGKEFKTYEYTDEICEDLKKIIKEENFWKKNKKIYIYVDDLGIDTLKMIPNDIRIRYNRAKIIDEARYLVNKKKDIYDVKVQIDTTYSKENIILTVYSIRNTLVEKLVKLANEYNMSIETIEPKESLFQKICKNKSYSVLFAYTHDRANNKIIEVYVYKKNMLITIRRLYYDLSKDNLDEEIDRTLKYCTGVFHDLKYDKVYVLNETWDGSEHYEQFKYEVLNLIKLVSKNFTKKLEEISFVPDSMKRMKIFIYSLLLIVLINVGLSTLLYYKANENQSIAESIANEVVLENEKLKKVTLEEQEISEIEKESELNIDGIKEVKSTNEFYQSSFLKYISTNIINDIKFEGISQKEKLIEIQGQAKTLEGVKSFVTILENNELISKVQTKKIDVKLENNITRFIIYCYLK
ncbi:MAG: hypothetical protein A2Y24_08045 [Clostridiales bacterium GWE2_32_10]|nr:MAG: hypothetical protein A2Y24_08045 [Clostridiales bacterium GWE2_32_10]